MHTTQVTHQCNMERCTLVTRQNQRTYVAFTNSIPPTEPQVALGSGGTSYSALGVPVGYTRDEVGNDHPVNVMYYGYIISSP